MKWFIHARRNASLFHLSLLMPALYGKGWLPVVDFYIKNVIGLGFSGKGCFVYLDQDELVKKRYSAIKKSIEKNENFISDFQARTNEMFGGVFFASNKIEEENLSLLPLEELGGLYKGYVDAVLKAPLITVQVYGIEALIDPDFRIVKEVKKKLKGLGRDNEFEKIKEILLANDGETVAFSERKDFYRVCVALDKPETRSIFEKEPQKISDALNGCPEIKSLIDTHIKKYHWINTEYLGTSWTIEKWLLLFKEALFNSKKPQERLSELLETFDSSQKAKKDLIEELRLSDDTRHAISALGEFLAQRDWTKGYLAQSLTSLHKLLEEIAKRMNRSFKDVLNFSYLEIFEYFKSGKLPSTEEISQRAKEGYAFRVVEGKLSLFTGLNSIQAILDKEKIESPVNEILQVKEIKGLVASSGIAKGKVRVIDSASKIPEFMDGEILVTYMTTIEFTPLFRKAIAIITDEGGMSCHAAIVSREFKLPCIVGTKIGTRALKTGDVVEVDANNGIIKIINE